MPQNGKSEYLFAHVKKKQYLCSRKIKRTLFSINQKINYYEKAFYHCRNSNCGYGNHFV